MRKIIGTLVCLLILSCQLSADSYQPMTYSAPETGFRSTSAYNNQSAITNNQSRAYRVNGFAAISASNYAALNSEGGACYRPNNAYKGPRRGRSDEDEAIGEYTPHSSIGDVPWWLMIVGFGVYAFYKKRKHTHDFY